MGAVDIISQVCDGDEAVVLKLSKSRIISERYFDKVSTRAPSLNSALDGHWLRCRLEP